MAFIALRKTRNQDINTFSASSKPPENSSTQIPWSKNKLSGSKLNSGPDPRYTNLHPKKRRRIFRTLFETIERKRDAEI